jgi:hypothetical protein
MQRGVVERVVTVVADEDGMGWVGEKGGVMEKEGARGGQ